jgi:peroxiredoxin
MSIASDTTKKQNEKDFNYPLAVFIFIALTVLVTILSLTLNDSSLEFSNQVAIESGIPAPDFTFPGLDGKMVSLSDYKGKVVLVNVWATWCPPCVDEMPSMEKLYRKFKGEKFEILAVSIDETGLKTVAPFMKKTRLTFPALIDSQGAIKSVYRITAIPESFIVDKQGLLIKKIVGPADWASPQVFGFFSSLIQKPLPR